MSGAFSLKLSKLDQTDSAITPTRTAGRTNASHSGPLLPTSFEAALTLACCITSTPTGARRRAFARHGARARVRVGRAVSAHVSYFRPHRAGTSTKNVAQH